MASSFTGNLDEREFLQVLTNNFCDQLHNYKNGIFRDIITITTPPEDAIDILWHSDHVTKQEKERFKFMQHDLGKFQRLL